MMRHAGSLAASREQVQSRSYTGYASVFSRAATKTTIISEATPAKAICLVNGADSTLFAWESRSESAVPSYFPEICESNFMLLFITARNVPKAVSWG